MLNLLARLDFNGYFAAAGGGDGGGAAGAAAGPAAGPDRMTVRF